MKKIIILILVVFAVSRLSAFTYEGLTYDIVSSTDRTCSVGSNTTASGDIVIPSQVYNDTVPYTVTKIAESAFKNCTGLKSIEIPASVTSIGNYAFNGCTGLKSIIFEDGEKSLFLGYNESASYTSSSNQIEGRGKGLFFDCPFNYIYLGRNCNYTNGRTSQFGNQYTVYDYGLSPFAKKSTFLSLTIGPLVTQLNENIFTRCANLSSVVFEDSETQIRIATTSFTSSILPTIVSPISTLYIGRNWVGGILNFPTLSNLEFGDKVTKIPESSFSGCTKITTLRLPVNVETIGANAFANNSNLRDIYSCNPVPPTVAADAFSSDIYYKATLHVDKQGLNDYKRAAVWKEFIHTEQFNPNATAIDGINYIFDNEKATAVVTYDKQTDLDNYKDLTAVTIPPVVEYDGKEYDVVGIGDDAFNYCWAIKSVELPETIDSIGNLAFGYCASLRSVNIPENTLSIGNEAFTGCSALASVVLNEKLTSIGDYAFFGCTGMAAIQIPSTVQTIGDNAFMGIHWMTDVYANGLTPHSAPETAFSTNAYKNATLHVPVGTRELYEAHPTWSRFDIIKDDFVTNAIEEIMPDADNNIEVYTIDGVKLNIATREDLNTLAKGVYIVNGKKFLVR